ARVSVHDPSVVIGYEAADGSVLPTDAEGRKKVYCIFGSHMAWAKSYDLVNWESFSNNINSSYATIFATDAEWSALGSSGYDVSGNLWAPDVIWNEQLQKWCMYMSVNGSGFYSSIVLLTAESLTGDWTRVGPVVYSMGMKAANLDKTDIWDILDKDSDTSDRYFWCRNSTSNRTYGTNAIDPCVFYDQEGNLWMTYGSWFGGLYLLRLDAQTGLRDKTYTYETQYEQADAAAAWNKMNINWAVSDAYQGIKIAGGNHCSGEASYIEYHDGRYWLFVTYGGLTAAGGYNMRVFSSESVTGPYTDISGDDARYSLTGVNGSKNAGQINRSVGTRLMSYYRWGFMNIGFCAQGHNSAVVDADGRMYLVYHTRFDDGTEGHQVRVHELFTFADGRIAAAPFEYRGEEQTSAAIAASAIPGAYGIIRHGNGTDYANLVCAAEQEVTLNADGTISGAYTGTWSASQSDPTISLTLKDGSTTETYTGRLLEQYVEETNVKTLCFTAVDNIDKSLWGYRKAAQGHTFADDVTIAIAQKSLRLPAFAIAGQKLKLASSVSGASITYVSDDHSLMSDDGQVPVQVADGVVNLTARISCGTKSYSVSAPVKIISSLDKVLPLNPDAILAHYPDGSDFATRPEVIVSEQTGLSLSFIVNGVASDWDVIASSSDDVYRLLLAVLHSGGTDYFEHIAKPSAAAQEAMAAEGKAAWQLFLGGTYYVTVSYNPDGTIDYYRDGKLMLTFDDTLTPSSVQLGTTAKKPSDIVKEVIAYYNENKLSFHKSVSDVIVGYSPDYEPAALVSTLPIPQESVLQKYASNLFYADADVPVGVTEQTGLSLSFLISGVDTDWDVIASSSDDVYHLLLAVLHSGGTDYYEHIAKPSAAAQEAMAAEGKDAWQLFLDGTYYVTVSYNPDGTIDYYRDGKLMLTFDDTLTPGHVQPGTTAKKPSEIVKDVVAAYNSGSLSFSRSVTSLVVGYAMGYSPSSDALPADVAAAAVVIRAEGSAIIVETVTPAKVDVYDVAGRKVFSAVANRIEGLAPGLYVVRTAGVSRLVAVK
ncbi:MAG: glycoside hydrolase family 43 protein, partial [Bacteroidales bacterium]|nr:glycoside hydrolase family 43 protein [Bacteroidales bacterium]